VLVKQTRSALDPDLTPLSYLFPALATSCVPKLTPLYIPALYPMPLSKPSPLASCSCIPKPMFYFPGDLVGPDPSSRLYCIFQDSWTRWSDWSRWSHRSSPLRFILYFPGLMRARRLRLNRHHRQWILPLSSNYIFQAGGAADPGPGKKLFVPGDLDPSWHAAVLKSSI